jgi:hypothetical protein
MSLSQCLLTKTKFYMIHDGGHIPDTDYGSYGWDLASREGILWEESFRAEGYGRMAGACFIDHFIRFFGIPFHDKCITEFHTDSQ